eukprot:CCRYP_008003-RA/>CCRYP_008003-RA protein AED:0.48 eAED:1.00 QI:0/0/0/1/1/1/2/0/93
MPPGAGFDTDHQASPHDVRLSLLMARWTAARANAFCCSAAEEVDVEPELLPSIPVSKIKICQKQGIQYNASWHKASAVSLVVNASFHASSTIE